MTSKCRVVSHVDLDAFYAQVERKAHPDLDDLPIAVIQYNPFGDLKTHTPGEHRVFNDSNGSIIAIAYGAGRDAGAKRNMRGAEARKLCPELQLVQVPTLNGKADLTMYRQHGQMVLDILSQPYDGVEVVCEKASIDESYLDVTDAARARLQRFGADWHACGIPHNVDSIKLGGQGGADMAAHCTSAHDWLLRPPEQWAPDDLLLAHGAVIIADKRRQVVDRLGYTCSAGAVCMAPRRRQSAGVAHSKILAKLCSGLHKPNQQTVLTSAAVTHLLHPLPLDKLRGLGGALGQQVAETLQVTTVGQLASVAASRLEAAFGEATGQWLYNMARGIDTDPVKPRTAPKSIGCGKSFRDHLAIRSLDKAEFWLAQLAQEIEARITDDEADNKRLPTLLTLHVDFPGGHKSKAAPLPRHDAKAIAASATALITAWAAAGARNWTVTGLSLVVSNFDSARSGTKDLHAMFQRAAGAMRRDAPAERTSARGEAGAPTCSDDATRSAAPAAAAPLHRLPRGGAARSHAPHLAEQMATTRRGASEVTGAAEQSEPHAHRASPRRAPASEAQQQDAGAGALSDGATRQQGRLQCAGAQGCDAVAGTFGGTRAPAPAPSAGAACHTGPESQVQADQYEAKVAQRAPALERCEMGGSTTAQGDVSADAGQDTAAQAVGCSAAGARKDAARYGGAFEVDAVLLASLPRELRSEVYLQGTRRAPAVARRNPQQRSAARPTDDRARSAKSLRRYFVPSTAPKGGERG